MTSINKSIQFVYVSETEVFLPLGSRNDTSSCVVLHTRLVVIRCALCLGSALEDFWGLANHDCFFQPFPCKTPVKIWGGPPADAGIA